MSKCNEKKYIFQNISVVINEFIIFHFKSAVELLEKGWNNKIQAPFSFSGQLSQCLAVSKVACVHQTLYITVFSYTQPLSVYCLMKSESSPKPKQLQN